MFHEIIVKEKEIKLQELKKEINSVVDEQKNIKQKLIYYNNKKKNSTNSDKIIKIDKKINSYNQKKEELDNQRKKLSTEIKEISKIVKKFIGIKRHVIGTTPSDKVANIKEYNITPTDKFADIMNISRGIILPRPIIVKIAWDYIKKNNLWDADNKRVIINDVLQDLFNIDENEIITFFNIHKLVTEHCIINNNKN